MPYDPFDPYGHTAEIKPFDRMDDTVDRTRAGLNYIPAPDVGIRLRALREHYGMERPHVQYLSGNLLNPGTLYRWEEGEQGMFRTKKTLTVLSKAFQMDPDILWDYLYGLIELEDVPSSLLLKQLNLPEPWVDALFPLVRAADEQRVTRVLEALRDRLLVHEEEEIIREPLPASPSTTERGRKKFS